MLKKLCKCAAYTHEHTDTHTHHQVKKNKKTAYLKWFLWSVSCSQCMFMPLCPLLIFVLDHICMPANIYIFVYSICVFVCVCLCLGGGYSLKNTSPQQSEGGRDERQRSQREAVCLQERGLNNGLRWSVAVTLAACVDAYGVLCCAL